MQTQKLWTRNFTIITLGTVVSLLGNAISGFAIGLLVLDYTQSTFFFALFMVVYNLPKIIMPMVAGPYLDRFSRTKVIYGLDFLSAGLYTLIFVLIRLDLFRYGPFLALCFLIGTIDSVYQVAYDSLYPTLVSEGNFSKAYSISSMLYPLSAIMVPVAAVMYNYIGLELMFLFNAVTFLVAACFETLIRAPETQIREQRAKFSLRGFVDDFRVGLRYIRGEKGLLIITAYFGVMMFATGSTNTLVLPHFKNDPALGLVWYTIVAGGGVVGRFVGGALHYRNKIPTEKKFVFAVFVYLATSLLEGTYLFTPLLVMTAMCFVSGLLSVTSYNIRISATQSYVPNDYRGRFNGTFQMVCTFGTIMGQLSSGALAEMISERVVIAAYMGLNALAVLGIILPGRKAVRAIYNRDV